MIIPPFVRWSSCALFLCIAKVFASDPEVALPPLPEEQLAVFDQELPMDVFMRSLKSPPATEDPDSEKEELPKKVACIPHASKPEEPQESLDSSESSALSNALSDGAMAPDNTAADVPSKNPEPLSSSEVSQVEA